MTCAEARRQLPGPDALPPDGVAQHLLECAPCRAEAEGLAEVDRRLHRLGVYRGLSVAELMLRLDEQLGQAPKAEQRGLRPATLLIAVTISLALLVGAALLLLLLSTR
jgi:hypothetical protein